MHSWPLISRGFARRATTEIIDLPGVDAAELNGNLYDLRRVNRLFGGAALTVWGLRWFVQNVHTITSGHVHPLSLLDIGCGLGDIPRSLLDWSATRGFALDVFATDISPQIIGMAQASGPSALHYAVADGMRLPLQTQSVDVAACSLTLHHFAPAEAVELLHDMRRVARCGLIVNDIVRSWPGLAGAWLFGHVFSQNRLTRHDGLASVQRAYTPAELRALAVQAGLRVAAMRGIAGYRVAMVLV
ncbi:MAG: methyltransferase domain-containing protein [Roseiflexaceae bacterium]|nr:methyltransferase domain-containing protein [Roseiflexaceae bacterium]